VFRSLRTHIRSFQAQFHCAYGVHSIHCAHCSFEAHLSQHKTQNVSFPSSDDKSSSLKLFRRVSALFSHMSTALCIVFFFSTCFSLFFIAWVLFPLRSLFSFISLHHSAFILTPLHYISYRQYLLKFPTFYSSFPFQMIHLAVELLVQPPDRTQSDVSQCVGLFLP
jgi:hypothetical protein